MGGIQKHRASSAKNKGGHRARKTKHYGRDHDQIHDDMKKPEKYEKPEVDETKPGSGQFYCVSCARYFESETTKQVHETTKRHKRQVKRMLDKPYTHEEAEAAGKW